MVTFHPRLGNVVKLSVVRDHQRGQVTMEIYDWQIFGILMIQSFCSFIIQKEILMNEWFHIILFTGLYLIIIDVYVRIYGHEK